MTQDNTQPEALRLAALLDEEEWPGSMTLVSYARACVAELCRQHARIADLEAQLEAIGAGGVTGPLIGQPQAMPDLSQLTERGAKAWAGVDAQELRECFTAADMATAAAQGFRDGVASLAANAGGPTCDMRTVVAVAVTLLYYTHPEDVCRVFDLNDLETIVSITAPLGHGRVEDIYRDAWDHVAAPPTAQAGGWVSVGERLPPPFEEMIVHPRPDDYCCEAFCDTAGNWKWAEYERNFGVHHRPCTVTHWKPNLPPTSAEGVEHG